MSKNFTSLETLAAKGQAGDIVYRPDRVSFSKLTTSRRVGRCVEAVSKPYIQAAYSIAPKETGEYVISFKQRAMPVRVSQLVGPPEVRWGVKFYNSAPYAVALETGYVNDNGRVIRGRHVMRKVGAVMASGFSTKFRSKGK